MPDFKRTINVTIAKEELEEILKEYLRVPKNAKVTFNLKTVSSYDDRYSHEEFGSVSVEYVEEPKSKSEKYERGF